MQFSREPEGGGVVVGEVLVGVLDGDLVGEAVVW